MDAVVFNPEPLQRKLGDALRHRTVQGVLAHGQQDVAMKFCGKSHDKFKDVEWEADVFGLPRIDGCVVAVACDLDKIIESGDHKIVIGSVVEVVREGALNPMVYARRKMLPFDNDGVNR